MARRRARSGPIGGQGGSRVSDVQPCLQAADAERPEHLAFSDGGAAVDTDLMGGRTRASSGASLVLTPLRDEPSRTGVHRRLQALLGVQGIVLAIDLWVATARRCGVAPVCWSWSGSLGSAVWQAGRLASRGRGLLALGFGAAGTVVGLGLGLPHASRPA